MRHRHLCRCAHAGSPRQDPNAARTIDLDTATVELLADWRAEHAEHFGGDDPNGWVFAKPDGTLLHPQSLSQALAP